MITHDFTCTLLVFYDALMTIGKNYEILFMMALWVDVICTISSMERPNEHAIITQNS